MNTTLEKMSADRPASAAIGVHQKGVAYLAFLMVSL